ncbi:MAG: thioredoxin domain-containing protein [Gordonia sp. (in: high G+C Gram-positive bacteria)]|uniref:DsbA family protein n=1 Tax=Gordonia sp. (in: high G+C Gram-positive bacteria) TaxID=84139 RepID=UPI003BB73C1F
MTQQSGPDAGAPDDAQQATQRANVVPPTPHMQHGPTVAGGQSPMGQYPSPQYPPQYPPPGQQFGGQQPPGYYPPYPAGTGTPPSNGRPGIWIGLVLAVVIAVIAGVLIYVLNRDGGEAVDAASPTAETSAPVGSTPAGQTSTGSASGSAPSAGTPRMEFLIGAGDRAPVKVPTVVVTVIEDYQCPACAQFNQRFGDTLTQIIATPNAAVEFVPISFLDRASTTNYSSRAWNASICVANSSSENYANWLTFQSLLLTQQPAEGGPGLTNEALAEIAGQAGANDVQDCILGETYRAFAEPHTQQVLAQPGFAGTPTVRINGEDYTLSTPQALKAEVDAQLR